MKAVVSAKGQVTIPQPLRRKMGIRAGQALKVSEEAGRLVLAKADASDPVDAVYGILKLGRSTNVLMAQLRGDALHL